MKDSLFRVSLLGMSILCGEIAARELIRNYTRIETEERVNGRLFVHIHDSLDGVVTDAWRIEGELVSKSAYEEAFLDGEREELRAKREREEKALALKESSKQQVRQALAKKLLAERVDFCRGEIAKLEACKLTRFMAFSPETFADATDYNRLVLELLPEAEAVLAGAADFSEPEKLTHLESELAESAGRLELFVQATFARASKECNDPKVLKKILELC